MTSRRFVAPRRSRASRSITVARAAPQARCWRRNLAIAASASTTASSSRSERSARDAAFSLASAAISSTPCVSSIVDGLPGMLERFR